ncbi:hypothetical protein AAY473_023358 [Plecturocebus cupreus]
MATGLKGFSSRSLVHSPMSALAEELGLLQMTTNSRIFRRGKRDHEELSKGYGQVVDEGGLGKGDSSRNHEERPNLRHILGPLSLEELVDSSMLRPRDIIRFQTGSCYVAQAGLELLASSNPPTLASQSAGIIGKMKSYGRSRFNSKESDSTSQWGRARFHKGQTQQGCKEWIEGLGKLVYPRLQASQRLGESWEKKSDSRVQWLMPVIAVLWEAEM